MSDIVGNAEKLTSFLIISQKFAVSVFEISYAYKAMIKKTVQLLLLQFKMTVLFKYILKLIFQISF